MTDGRYLCVNKNKTISFSNTDTQATDFHVEHDCNAPDQKHYITWGEQPTTARWDQFPEKLFLIFFSGKLSLSKAPALWADPFPCHPDYQRILSYWGHPRESIDIVVSESTFDEFYNEEQSQLPCWMRDLVLPNRGDYRNFKFNDWNWRPLLLESSYRGPFKLIGTRKEE
jgi:hypothetical protein